MLVDNATECEKCTIDDNSFMLCVHCHDEQEAACNNLNHAGKMIRYHGVDSWVQCQRIRDPPNRSLLRCSKCYMELGQVYLRKWTPGSDLNGAVLSTPYRPLAYFDRLL